MESVDNNWSAACGVSSLACLSLLLQLDSIFFDAKQVLLEKLFTLVLCFPSGWSTITSAPLIDCGVGTFWSIILSEESFCSFLCRFPVEISFTLSWSASLSLDNRSSFSKTFALGLGGCSLSIGLRLGRALFSFVWIVFLASFANFFVVCCTSLVFSGLIICISSSLPCRSFPFCWRLSKDDFRFCCKL